MNPIASLTTPTVLRDGGTTGAAQKTAAPVQSDKSMAANPLGPVMTMTAVASVGAADPAARTSLRNVQENEPKASKAPEDSERIETSFEVPETGARPARPLRSFAQIPTEMIQEINRMREDSASTNARGTEGRQDPTPMPAATGAIGPAAA